MADIRMEQIAEYLVKMGVDASVYEPNGPVTCVRVTDDCGQVWLFGTANDTWGASLDTEDEDNRFEYLETHCDVSETDMFKIAQAINLAINPNSGRR